MQESPDTLPLFTSDEPLELRLVADFGAIRRDRSDDPEDRAALIVLADGDTVDAELRPRGNSRRDPRYCSFPPLRLDVKRGSAEGTVFEGQDKLKLVVPCRPERPGYEEYVLREYLLYRVHALLSPYALRVRPARVTFVDANDPDDAPTRWTFVIESEEELAARLGGQIVEVPAGKGILPAAMHPVFSTVVAVFEYMIGNTDWEDLGVHNMLALSVGGRVVPVPYDFDLAGAVETPYAAPAAELPIRSVRQRLYRGWCWQGVQPESVLGVFHDARPAIEALYRDFPHLPAAVRDETLDYFAQFYANIETADVAQRRLFQDCRDPG